MRAKRYELQFCYLEDSVRYPNPDVKWYSLQAGASRRRRRAVSNWWHKVNTNTEKKMFRLMDTKTGKVIR